MQSNDGEGEPPLVLFISYRHTLRMGVQALALGKIGNAGCHLAQRLAGVIEETGLLHKVVHTQRAGEAGRAAGGQGVVGSQ